MMQIVPAAALLLSFPLLAACGGAVESTDSSSPDGGPAPVGALQGHWGEDDQAHHAQLDAAANGATYLFDCMQGSSAAIVPADDGTFSVKGTAIPTGGYIPPTPYPATFTGTVSGTNVTLTVQVVYSKASPSGSWSAAYTLTPGVLAGDQLCI
jgi:hypothetical protein